MNGPIRSCMLVHVHQSYAHATTNHTGIASGIADVSDVHDQVSLVNLVVHKVGGIECRLLSCHDLKTVIHLPIAHVCESKGKWF